MMSSYKIIRRETHPKAGSCGAISFRVQRGRGISGTIPDTSSVMIAPNLRQGPRICLACLFLLATNLFLSIDIDTSNKIL